MNYEFPKINHIDDVRYIAEMHDEIVIADRGDYTIFDYAVSFADTFPPINRNDHIEKIYHDKVMREFRGMIFCNKTGKILRRPYHKFFNYGEREETMFVDLSQSHIILSKLDGSMISPFIFDDYVYWGTRLAAEAFHDNVSEWLASDAYRYGKYDAFAKKFIASGVTPMFEWTGPNNRIVIGYDEPNLILTGARSMFGGHYINYKTLEELGKDFNIPVVDRLVFDGTIESLSKITSALTSEEGYVVAFDDGHRIKMKSDWYCQLHRIKSHFTLEKDVVRVILENNIDDMISVLDEADRNKINSYSEKLHDAIKSMREDTLDILNDVQTRGYTKKDFALHYHNVTPTIKPLIFKLMDSHDVSALEKNIISIFIGHTSSGPKWQEFKKKNKIELEW